ncbi:MAG: hypothetical protein R3C13_10985 [Hyphomonas sp.]|uniref:hypothetical protein n=1 Tax=Hyphomonas sp. TaxID=87 RepID=UPI0035277F88
MLSRRYLLALIASLPAACVRPGSGASLVSTYDPAREASIYPEGPPFVAVFAKGKTKLGWVAAVHTPAPQSPTADTIALAFAAVRPRAVVLEGFPTRWGANPDRILRRLSRLPEDQGDEGDVAARAALASGADIWGGEPTDAELAAALAGEGYAADDIFYTALLGPLEQDQRNGVFSTVQGPEFEESFLSIAAAMAPSYAVDAPSGPEGFRNWFNARFGVPLEDDPEWFTRGWPGKTGIGAEISRASNRLRDVHAYTVATDRVRTHGRVVVVYGGSHLSSVWGALEHDFGPPHLQRPPH